MLKKAKTEKKVSVTGKAKFPIRVPVHVYQISKKHYFPKMRGAKHPVPPRPDLLYVFVTFICASLAISALYAVSYYTDSVMIMAPFGATCVLLFGAPDSPLAQPRNVVGGHFIATLISLFALHIFGDQWYVVALSVGVSIAVMQLTRTLHPPAGADPLVVILTHASWDFIFVPVLIGAFILVLCGVITNNFSKHRHYPKYWW